VTATTTPTTAQATLVPTARRHSRAAAIRLGLAYGMLATRRRRRALILPAVTVATGSFLLVQVLTLTGAVRSQAATFGGESEVLRATVLIAVVVLLVGVVEVAVCTTRTVVHRTREMGVLAATGVPRAPVVAALLVEPVLASVAGALGGGLVSALAVGIGSALGLIHAQVSTSTAILAVLVTVLTSALAAVVTSVVPVWRAASRPPVHSLGSI
jgi:ABC-type antimicrobial peptide transport system permease subunit